MEPRIIKTDQQHRRYVDEARRLAKQDPAPQVRKPRGKRTR
jgi:hypothetical protein